ncbi:hypothetical protein GW7_07823 [Heterocephalus glaber]|uniref:PX domain-containing protein 1 n=1 Tax=Heterocephalus glaber TaxID=10181 RepID=G5BGL5_HETGA|nr:hypothetical protein GW7_07823 [Heterocephalus glaber]
MIISMPCKVSFQISQASILPKSGPTYCMSLSLVGDREVTDMIRGREDFCGLQWSPFSPLLTSPSPISPHAEIMRSNGFCLANTETIVIDHSISNGKDQHQAVDPAEHLFENGGEFTLELEDGDDPAAYVTNLSYYHLVPFETDILD